MDTSMVLLATIAMALLTPCLLYPTKTLQWARRKKYQYEVTFSLYMWTPAERFVFNSILFLTISLVAIATLLYLPNHLVIMSRRAVYYYSGSVVDVAASNSKDFILSFARKGPNATPGSTTKQIVPMLLSKSKSVAQAARDMLDTTRVAAAAVAEDTVYEAMPAAAAVMG